jgi:two-component system response regulator MprA
MRLLLVEDDMKMAEVLRRGLEEEGYSIFVASDGRQGLEIAESCELDGIILDVMLPKMDGFEVARRLRRNQNQTPILMLTARDAVHDVVTGLDKGADDYLTKPFSFDVLLARLRAITRRGGRHRPPHLRLADLVLDPATHEVTRGGRKVALTKTEYKLLECLMRRAGTVVPREGLIEDVWGFNSDVENNTLDAFIRLLRGKIDAGFEQKLLHTVRGIGYSLRLEKE